MEQKKKCPAIRFSGFSEEWENNSFKTLTKINQGLQIAISERYTKRIENSFFYITNEFLKEGAKSEYYILNPPENVVCNKEDVLMTRTGNTGEVVTNVNGAFHNNFFKIKFNKNQIDKNYFVNFLKLERTQLLISQLAGVSTIPDLNHNDFYNIKMDFPSKPEQAKIGLFFENLDQLLTKHQTQHKKLKALKKAMLGKLFPKKGATTPEIRFKGFTGDWEVKTFKDIFEYHRPDNYIVKSDEYDNKNNIPVLTANKSFILGYTNEVNTFNDNSIIIDDFTLDSKFVDFPFMVKSSALKILTIKNDNTFNIRFAYSLLKTTKIEIMGHARHYINVVQKTKVLSPSLKEQNMIANYFRNLDQLITKHATQIEKLGTIKKACLSKMFV